MDTITKLIRPVREPHRVTSPYGHRKLAGKDQFHDGIDYVSGSGSREVVAIADGVVCLDVDFYEESKRWTDGRHSGGNMLIIKHRIHGADYYCRYLHLITNTVAKGEAVLQGRVIGEYADVGYSFGAHLHFDMFDSEWKKIDPTPVMMRGLPA